MIINSNPFVYNEGFPTYTDIEAVNDRVTELENDESLLNISKTDAVESLSASLNKLIEDRAKKISSVDITATNNVNAVHFSGAILAVKHNLNSQVGIFQNMLLNNIADNQAFDTLRAENIKATGGTLTDVNFVNVNFVEPQDTTFDNLIVDNLTVVNDFTATILNQSNFDNVMITNSNVYNSFLRNAEMQGDHADIEYAYINHMTTDGIDLNVFQVTPQTEPVNSNTALGYDLNGNVIPVKPLYLVDLVPDAEYISVDINGDAIASTKSRTVEESENLITAHAVGNAFEDFNNYIADEDANVYQLFEDTVNNLHNGFNDFNNDFNNFNAGITDTFNGVNNEFNNLNNSLNDLNNTYNNFSNLVGPEVFNTLNGYNNTLNNHNNSLNGLGDVANAIADSLVPPSKYYNSTSLTNYQNIVNIQFVNANLCNPANCYDDKSVYNASRTTLGPYELNINTPENEYLTLFKVPGERGYIACYNGKYQYWVYRRGYGYQDWVEPPFNMSAVNAQNLYISVDPRINVNRNGVDFYDPHVLKKLSDYNSISMYPSPLNNQAISTYWDSASNTFVYGVVNNSTGAPWGNTTITNPPANFYQEYGKWIFNKNMGELFNRCTFNKPIEIPNYVTSMYKTFNSSSFNQPINIGTNVINMSHCFAGSAFNNQPVNIISNVVDMCNAFRNVINFNRPINLPESLVNIAGIFAGNNVRPSMFNQLLDIPNNVTNISELFRTYAYNIGELNNANPGYYYADAQFNQPINIGASVKDMSFVFGNCHQFNHPVNIPEGCLNIKSCFDYCWSFNQPVNIPDSVVDADSAFWHCWGKNSQVDSFNSPVTISPNSNLVNMTRMFVQCRNFNQPLYVPKNVTNIAQMLYECSSYNQEHLYLASTKLNDMGQTFFGVTNIHYVHINADVPRSTSNYIYNSLVNGYTGITFTSDRILSDL